MDRLRKPDGEAARPVRFLVVPALSLAVLALAGCGGGGERAPTTLLDGSSPPPLPPALRALEGGAVMTRVRVLRVGAADRSVRACLALSGPVTVGPDERLVERVGVDLRSLTFAGRPEGWVRGCDGTAAVGESRRGWCGVQVGRRRPSGVLFDPRLDLLCRAAGGAAVGAAWVDALPRARYLALEGPGYAEVYRVVSGLPVRVSTRDVRVDGSSATFRVAQYAADGSRLSRRALRAVVAG